MAHAEISLTLTGFDIANKTTIEPANQVGAGILCGEDILRGAAVYIGSDGRAYNCGGSGVSALTDNGAHGMGIAMNTAKFNAGGIMSGAVTILTGIDISYGVDGSATLTPGAWYYISVVSATKGRLSTDAAAFHTGPITGMLPFAVATGANTLRILAPV